MRVYAAVAKRQDGTATLNANRRSEMRALGNHVRKLVREGRGAELNELEAQWMAELEGGNRTQAIREGRARGAATRGGLSREQVFAMKEMLRHNSTGGTKSARSWNSDRRKTNKNALPLNQRTYDRMARGMQPRTLAGMDVLGIDAGLGEDELGPSNLRKNRSPAQMAAARRLHAQYAGVRGAGGRFTSARRRLPGELGDEGARIGPDPFGIEDGDAPPDVLAARRAARLGDGNIEARMLARLNRLRPGDGVAMGF